MGLLGFCFAVALATLPILANDASLAQQGGYPAELAGFRSTWAASSSTVQLTPAVRIDDSHRGIALAIEVKEQDQAGAFGGPFLEVFFSSSIRKSANSELLAPRLVLSAYPLRC